MKKSLIIIFFLLSFGAMAQKPGLTVIDTTFGSRQVVGQLHKVVVDFADSTYQIEVTHKITVDTIQMRTARFIISGKWSAVNWLPLNTTQMNRIKNTATGAINWRKGTIKNGAK
jgi:hypothetical protein